MRTLPFFTAFAITTTLALAHAAPARACEGQECSDDEGDHDHDHDRDHDAFHKGVDETRAAKPTGKVEIHVFSGAIKITGWTQNFVHVKGEIDDDCKVDVTPSGDRTEIGVHCDHGPGEGDLEIQVPQGSAVEASGMSADVDVRGVNGALQLHSVTADIAVHGGAPSEIEAGSTSGSVSIDASSPRTRARSVSGDVKVTGARGHATVRSVSGQCSLAGTAFDDVSIESVSGDVTFDGTLTSDARAELHTHSGSIDVRVPRAANADVELRTMSGELVIDVGGKTMRDDGGDHRHSRTLDQKLGNGGAKIRAHSFSGDVSVKGK